MMVPERADGAVWDQEQHEQARLALVVEVEG